MTAGWIRKLALALTFALGLMASVQAQSVDDIVKAGKIRIGVLADLPRYGLMNTKGEIEGLDADVARLLGKYLGVKVELVPVTSPNRIPFLLTNKVDVLVATFGITPERAKQVSFSIPYNEIATGVMASKKLQIKSFADLAKYRVAVPRGGTGDMGVTQGAPKGTTILRLDDDSSASQALVSGQADALGNNLRLLDQMQKDNPGLELEQKFVMGRQFQGVTVRRGATDLLQWVNTFVYYIRNNGELDAITRKWFNQPLGDMPTF